jgi:RNA polymerase sigma factor (sigma-70 family)
MTPDFELLAAFARTHSEDAFAELVRRHLGLVYSAAVRQVQGDEHLAKDVAQLVFCDLARKASSLSRRDNLAGWLYTGTHYAAAKLIRGAERRRRREEEFMGEPTNANSPEVNWEAIRPALDAAMHELKAADREAILLRYFENRPFAEVGARLGLNENAARMRVDRAVEKLRAAFVRRGIPANSTLAAVISAHAVQLAPVNLAATVTTASLASSAAGTLTLFKIMTTTQLKFGLGALLIAGAAATLVIQHRAQTQLRDENAALLAKLTQSQTDWGELSNRLAAAAGSQSAPANQFAELLQLRGEVGSLRHQLAKAGNAVAPTAARPAPTAEDPEVQQRKLLIQKMGRAKNLVAAAFFGFAEQHQNQAPTNWDQVVGYFDEWERKSLNPGDAMPDTVAEFTQLTNEFDFVYQGLTTDIAKPADAIVVKEKQAWQSAAGKWFKTYGFADGHSQIQAEPPEGFEAYEQNHAPSPPPNPGP